MNLRTCRWDAAALGRSNAHPMAVPVTPRRRSYDREMSELRLVRERLRRISIIADDLDNRLGRVPFLERCLDGVTHVDRALQAAESELRTAEKFLRPELVEFFPIRLKDAVVKFVKRARASGKEISARDGLRLLLESLAYQEEETRARHLRNGSSPYELPPHLLQAIANAPDAMATFNKIARAVAATLKETPPKTRTRNAARAAKRATDPMRLCFDTAKDMKLTRRPSVDAYKRAYGTWQKRRKIETAASVRC